MASYVNRYIGNKTREVNLRLHSIKPPHKIPRVPRNIEQASGWKGIVHTLSYVLPVQAIECSMSGFLWFSIYQSTYSFPPMSIYSF